MRITTAITVLLVFSLGACKGKKNLYSAQEVKKEIELLARDSLAITIKAINLSEDMSRLSSNDDEVLILIYELRDSVDLEKFLFSKRLVFNKRNQSEKLWFSTSKQLTQTRLLLLLIEQDSETPIEQIDPIIRIHHKTIIEAFNSRNYLEIEKYLGDEDILGVKSIASLPTGKPVVFNFMGIHKFDRYEYLISLSKQ